MKKLILGLAACGLVIAAPASATTLSGPYKSFGACNMQLANVLWNIKKHLLGYSTAKCVQVGSSWYIVA